MWHELSSTIKSIRRMGKTGFVLQKSGMRYLLNRDQPLPYLLRDAMEELGATYIKLGQLIASSPSIFPHQYVEAFQDCLDQAQPIDFSIVEDVLQQEFGDSLSTLFSHIDPQPLASASIAQVHAATLQTGEDVVIKVQKPGVRNVLETDFQFMQFSARVVERFSPRSWESSITDIVAEIRNGMLEECDFYTEAENIRLYQQFLESNGNDRVRVPKVYERASTLRVLTMERFYGVGLTDINQVRKYTNDPEQALIDSLDTWYQSLHQCQIYHADLHAGNVMLLEDGSVGFIDFGIVGHISPPTWEALTSLAVCVPAKDFQAIAQALATIGVTKHSVDVSCFAEDLESLYLSLSEEDEGLDFNDFIRQLTLQISGVAQRHGIRFPREFTLLVKQFLYFDRYIRILAPELDMLGDERLLEAF